MKVVRVRHPFRVTAIVPRVAFSGTPHAHETGDATVRLEAPYGVGLAEVMLHRDVVQHLSVGKTMTVEIIGPDPLGELFGLEIGNPGEVIESESVRAVTFEIAKRIRASLRAVPSCVALRIGAPGEISAGQRTAVQEIVEEEIKKAIAEVLR